MPLLTELTAFVAEHQACGDLVGNALLPTHDGYRLVIVCWCGKVFDRWVSGRDAVQDLLHATPGGRPD